MSPDISICVCTYRRPTGLQQLLSSITELVSETPSFEIIVIDNDGDRSGEDILTPYRATGIPISYFVEPVKNISRARNRAVAVARAELIAFIDDDEVAEPAWLTTLHKTLIEHAADAVFGPVLHRFAVPPPQWLANLDFWNYPVPDTGSEVPRHQFRTGNVLFRKTFAEKLTYLFDENLGLSGGEDTDFFSRMSTAGGKLIASQEAVVYETVPTERMGMDWLTRRYYRYGIGKIKTSLRNGESTLRRLGYFLSAAINLGVRLIASIFWYPFNRGLSARNYLKAAYQFGICAGFLGLRYFEYK